MVLAVIVFAFYSTTSSSVYGTFMTKPKVWKTKKFTSTTDELLELKPTG